MNFYKFMGIMGGIYALYYLFAIGYDLYFANRNSENEDRGEDIDISDSLEKYVPADAEEIAKKEAGEEKTEEEEKEAAAAEKKKRKKMKRKTTVSK